MRSSQSPQRLLENLRSERNDLHEPALAQLAGHRPEDARADRLALIVDENGRIAIEADVAAVAAPLLLHGAHDDRLHDLPLLHIAFRRRFLHRRRDDVAEAGVAAGRSADRVDDGDLARAGIVRHVDDRSHLYHDCFSTAGWAGAAGWAGPIPLRPFLPVLPVLPFLPPLYLDGLPHDAPQRPALAPALRARL